MRRCDIAAPTIPWDEVHTSGYGGAWPKGALELYESIGLLREVAPALDIAPFECVHGISAEPVWSERPDGSRVGSLYCGDRWCGPHRIPFDRMRQWAFSLEALAGHVAAALGLEADLVTEVPGRLVYLGAKRVAGGRADAFLAKEAYRGDFPVIAGRSSRFMNSANAVVYCMSWCPLSTEFSGHVSFVSVADTFAFVDGRIEMPKLSAVTVTPASPVALTDTDRDVLQALSEDGGNVSLADLQERSGHGRRAVDASVSRLLLAGFVRRPKGTTRKGVTVTAAGRAEVLK